MISINNSSTSIKETPTDISTIGESSIASIIKNDFSCLLNEIQNVHINDNVPKSMDINSNKRDIDTVDNMLNSEDLSQEELLEVGIVLLDMEKKVLNKIDQQRIDELKKKLAHLIEQKLSQENNSENIDILELLMAYLDENEDQDSLIQDEDNEDELYEYFSFIDMPL